MSFRSFDLLVHTTSFLKGRIQSPGRGYSLYNGIRGCAADLGIDLISFCIDSGYRHSAFGIVCVIQLSDLVLIWVIHLSDLVLIWVIQLSDLVLIWVIQLSDLVLILVKDMKKMDFRIKG